MSTTGDPELGPRDNRPTLNRLGQVGRVGDPVNIGDLLAREAALASHLSSGKPQVGDLDPQFILEMGEVMTQGLTKYPNDPDGTPNWYKGGDYRSFYASMMRHLLKVMAGEDIDDESGKPHLAHLAVDASFVRSWQRRGVGKDTRLGDVRGVTTKG